MAPAGQARPLDDPHFREASEACRHLAEAARPELTDEQKAEFQDAPLRFARCMRAEGVDVPDPKPGEGPVGIHLDRNDPKAEKAIEKCQQILDDALPGAFQRQRRGGS